LSIPNYITLVRILLIPFFFTALLSYQAGQEKYRWIAFALFLVASLTDAIDGYWARTTKSQTALGRFLDPLADKALLLSGYLGILFVSALPYRPPLWITVTIVFRDMIIVIGLILIFMASGQLKVEPNLAGKLATAFQMATLVSILAAHPISMVLWNITAALTIWSGLSYVLRDFIRLKI
jgi:cardiolipin synthase